MKAIKILLLSSMMSCGESEFASSSPTNKPVPVEEKVENKENKEKEEISFDAKAARTKKVVENEPIAVKSEPLVKEIFSGSETTSSGKVDIVFAVDTSGSMGSEKEMLESNMNNFLTDLQKVTNLDYRTFLIGKNFNFPNLSDPRFSAINIKVHSRDALDVVTNFFEGNLDDNLTGNSYREGVTKELVIITDDNSRTNADRFSGYVSSNKDKLGEVHVNGLVGLPDSKENSWCNLAQVGSVYSDLAQMDAHKGLIQDLCIEDWSKLLENLATSIIKKNVQKTFELKKGKIDVSKDYKVTVDGSELVLGTHYGYDFTKNMIFFAEDSAPANGAEIVLEYHVLEEEKAPEEETL